ncbi:hypothetical protein TRIP_B200783 [uncultured Desulfatiglans sp.]|nr:hypothetical protein TRIP_B200783 [uncultured Desulfatiglans sp.]
MIGPLEKPFTHAHSTIPGENPRGKVLAGYSRPPVAHEPAGLPSPSETPGYRGLDPKLPSPDANQSADPHAFSNSLHHFFDLALLFHQMAREMTPQDIQQVVDAAIQRRTLLTEAAQKKEDGADILQNYATDALAVSIAGASFSLGGEKTAALAQSMSSTSQAVSSIGQAKNQTELAKGDKQTAQAEYTRAQQDMSNAFFQSFSQTAQSIRRSLGEMLQAELAAKQAVGKI